MNIKDIIRKQTTTVAIAIVLVAIALLGVSYAIFFDVKANEKNQVITAGTLKLTITTEEKLATISGDSLVMINDIGLTSDPLATFTVNHTEESNLPAAYTIYLDLEATDESKLEEILEYVKISTDGETYFGINNFTEDKILTIEDKTYYEIEKGILEVGASGSTKELRLWLDEDMITQDIITDLTINLYIITEVADSLTVDDIIAKSKQGTGVPNFANTSCTNGTNNGGNCGEETVGLYECIIKEDGQCAKYDENRNPIDDEGNILDTANLKKTYYYRGDVKDNYVKFAGFYWRIIRINENGSIRMIYQGRTRDDEGNKLEIQNTGEETQIGVSAFNENYDQAEYVGFKYALGSVHGTETKSTILEYLEEWYTEEDNELQNYAENLDTESGFCGDRSAYTDSSGTIEGGGTGTANTYYGAYTRLYNKNNPTPTFECPNSEDLYTTSASSIGNKSLNYPIGLITADEVAYAGGRAYNSFTIYMNESYYLCTGSWYWMLSPYYFGGSYAFVFLVYDDGNLIDSYVDESYGVRPVINLSTDNLTISGSGTAIDPYVIS